MDWRIPMFVVRLPEVSQCNSAKLDINITKLLTVNAIHPADYDATCELLANM